MTEDRESLQVYYEIQKHPAFRKYERFLTKQYVHIVASQDKDGKRRKYEYSHKKLMQVINSLESYKFEQLFKDPFNLLKSKAWIYQAGVVDNGHPLLVFDFGRIDISTHKEKLNEFVALSALSIMSIIENSSSSQAVAVELAHNVKLSVTEYFRAFLFVRKIAIASLRTFPDRLKIKFQFLPPKLNSLLQLHQSFFSPQTKKKAVIGSYDLVKAELDRFCKNSKSILPQDLGGTSQPLEQNIAWFYDSEGLIRSRMLTRQESNGYNIFVQ